MNQGNERTTSMSKTKGLVQMAIFAALIVVLATITVSPSEHSQIQK